MRKILSVAALSLGLAGAALPARADIAVGAGVGTLGYGVHVATSMTDFIGLRFNANFGEMDVPGAELIGQTFGGISYDVDASFKSYGLIADFHPLALSPIGSGLVLQGGLYYNKNEFDFSATPTNDVQIGAVTLPGGSGSLLGNMSFDSDWVPYIGMGYDGTFQGLLPVSFFLTGGILFQGSANVSLTTTDPLFNAAAGAELQAEARQIENDISNYKYYPVISMGVTISF